MTVSQIIKQLGWHPLAKKLGVGRTAVANAKSTGTFPASWYFIIREMCDEAGIELDDGLFNWKSAQEPPSGSGKPK
ncbi:hypothetical protein [Leisingera sp. NJS204]|uniref:hypothetical protein n=1 Tax=Leisingera sp. NJS204 TaxID=2508307 RepID=UPI001011B1B6|nr:hypothetical protein [Leisingera sp. NJS204]QAX31298.1 hypothetical protein ETW24_19005 [Leisingera sp. NJS204]